MSYSPADHTPSPSHSNLITRASFPIPSYTGIETPPPPPPKPGSHEQSRRGTPLGISPVTESPTAANHESAAITAGVTSEAHGDGTASAVSMAEQAVQVQPPALEDGWLPSNVKDKSTADLQSILSNPTLLSGLANTHPSHAASVSSLQAAVANNVSLAKHLLTLEADLANLRASTELLLLQHQSLDLAWRKKQSEVDAALEPWSPKALYQRLIAGIAEQEAVVKAVEESFLEGGLEEGKASEREVMDWLRRVRSESAKLEARKEAKNRWDEGRVGGWR
ncbi:hypothetical protein KEM54_001037 [Ascosphaera aggregata]|nr:hypothetical protein KEM54_001037 [Ascosphaera aggregata]